MQNLIFFLATSLVLRRSVSRKFKNYLIGNTGCSVLLLPEDCEPGKSKTSSGDDLYFHEFTEKKVSYGVICIQLKNILDLNMAKEMLQVYIDTLRTPFSILHHVGLSKETDWNSSSSRSVVDYWQDANGIDWKVKGYTNGQTVAVLYVKNICQAPVNKQDLFLDGFHFNRAH